MDNALKALAIFLIAAGSGVAAIRYPEPLHKLYKTYISPDPVVAPFVPQKVYVPPPLPDDPTEVGKTMYIAGQKDVLGWGEEEISLYFTYDGSSLDGKQAVTGTLENGQAVHILESAHGKGGLWYRISTVENFSRRGWVPARYVVGHKPGDVKHGKDWGEAKEKADKDLAAREEAERKREKELHDAENGNF